MPLGILGASLIGGGVGGLAGLFGKSKQKSISTLSPEQEALQKTLGGSLNARIGQGPQTYQGEYTAPIGQGELDAISNFNRLAALSGTTLESLINVDPQALNTQFDEQIARPTFRRYAEETLPLLEEALPSFSIARGQTRANALRDVEENLMAQRFSAQESARDRSLSAIGQAQSLGSTATAINAIPREILQSGLDKQYSEFVRSNEQYGQDINSALGFLGVQTKAITEEPNAVSRLLQGALAGAGAGAQIGSSIANSNAINKYLATLQGGR